MTLLFNTVKSCTRCHLSSSDNRLSPTPGRGAKGDYFIVGLAPSWYRINLEKSTDIIMPFGDQKHTSYWLGEVLSEIKWPLEKTYITNVIKCSLPDNRSPVDKDISACYKLYFFQELCMYRPKIIICLGNLVYDILKVREELTHFKLEKVFHHSYIARTPSKYSDWKIQWEQLIEEYGIKKT
ncbi:MAG: uracil-DNA glycosylase family protein [Nanoarchaeota archaeon]